MQPAQMFGGNAALIFGVFIVVFIINLHIFAYGGILGIRVLEG